MTVGRARTSVALSGLALATFVFITAETLPIGLLPTVARDLAVSQSAVGLLVSAYALTVVVATIPLTRVTARVPRRLLLPALLAVLVLSLIGSAVAPSYPVLLVARVVGALAQALFWAVVLPAGAALVGPRRQGRAVSIVYAGSSVATVVGIPLGTAVGQAADWRTAFLATSVLGVLALAVVGAALPSARGGTGDAGTGSAPDAHAYAVLVTITAVSVTGAFVAFTYVNPFLTDVGGLPGASVAPVLLIRGAAGLGAVLVVGRFVDRIPRGVLPVVLGAQAAGLAVQWLGGGVGWAAALGVVVSGAAFSAFSAALGARVLVVAPGSTDVATAGTSTAFNVGIMLGAGVGAAALPVTGSAAVPLLAGVAVLLALVLAAVPRRRAAIHR